MDEGYVKLWRKSLNSTVFANSKLWMFWCWCIMKATWKPMTTLVGFQKIDLLPGQFIFGRIKAAEEIPLSETTIRTCIKTLIKLENMTIKTTNKFSIITICNWDTYQSTESENDQQNDQQTTNKRPTNDHKQEVKELKEGKEVKDEKKKDKYSCMEPEKEPDSTQDVIFIELPLNDKSQFPITESIIFELSPLYPAVDVEQQFREMKGWLLADQKRLKTKRGIKRFYTGWLSRKQNRGNPHEYNKSNPNIFINE